MTYIQTNNRYERRRLRAVVFVCAVLIVATVGLQLFVPHFLPAFFNSIARPFWRAEFSIGSGSLSSTASLLNENENLKRQLEDLKLISATVAAVADENRELKSLMGRSIQNDQSISASSTASTTASDISLISSKTGSRILAAVLVHPPLSPYDEFIIDAGTDVGLTVGDKVYAADNLLIGQVSEVLGQTSKVILYSSPGQHYEVMIGSAHTPAQAIGTGGGQYSAELPSIVKVTKGDQVIVPSLNDKPFGIVNGVTSDPASAFETVLFAPQINPYQIRWVTVEKVGK